MRERFKREFEKDIEYNALKDLPTTIDALNEAIAEIEPRLRVGDNSVTAACVREYQSVAKELDSCEKEKQEVENRCRKFDQDFETTLARWRPKAESVMSTINQNFRRFIESIGCAGQVSLRIPEDTVSLHLLRVKGTPGRRFTVPSINRKL